MVCPSIFIRLVIAALFGTFGAGAASLFAQEEALVPAQFNSNLTDNLGNRWDVNHTGAINDGTNDCFDTGASLRINGGGLGFARPMMTADKSEYVFTGRQGALSVTRRVRLDAKVGAMRFLEILENPQDQPQNVTVSVVTNLGGGSVEVVDSKNRLFFGQLAKDEGAFFAMPHGSRPGVVFLVADPRAKEKPKVQIQNNRTFEVTYQFEIPAQGSVAILHYLAQRLNVQSGGTADLIKAYYKGGRLIDRQIPEKYIKILANFSAPSEGGVSEDLGVPLLAPLDRVLENVGLTREKHDTLMLDAGAKLAGTVTGGDFTIETGFGKTQVPFADVAGITGGAGVQKPIRVFLRSGEILSGLVSDAKLAMATDTGLSFDVDLTQIQLLALKRTETDGKPSGNVASLITTHSGDRFALASDSGAELEAATPWGMARVPISEVDLLTYEREPFPSHRLVLADGSRLLVMMRGGEWSLTTPRFGKMKILPQSVREIRQVHTVAKTVAEGDADGEGVAATPACTLIGENRIAGVIDLPALHLTSDTSAMSLDPKQILELQIEKGEGGTEEMTTVKLVDGQELRGRLTETMLPIRAGKRVWRVPVTHVVSVTVPPPSETVTEDSSGNEKVSSAGSLPAIFKATEVRK